jgi:hypothetical protein
MHDFLKTLRTQRWDDYRYYHQSRVNQTLHLISAAIFLVCYAMLFKDPGIAALIGWVAMIVRQTGHFFFEPTEYDEVNHASNDYKEAIKVGFNQHRKIILLFVWALTPLVLYIDPSFFGLFTPTGDRFELLRHVGLLWLAVGVGGAVTRAAALTYFRGPETALAWLIKVLTDPFDNLIYYRKAPLALLRGEWIDTSIAAANAEWAEEEGEEVPHAG